MRQEILAYRNGRAGGKPLRTRTRCCIDQAWEGSRRGNRLIELRRYQQPTSIFSSDEDFGFRTSTCLVVAAIGVICIKPISPALGANG